jgi:hypothetical protein
MEHKLDDFFSKKIELVQDTPPESSTFDEQIFWGELQKNINKPRTKGWWKWAAIAACMTGLILLGVFASITTPETPKVSNIPKAQPARESVNQVPAIVIHETRAKSAEPKKKKVVQPTKNLAIEVAQLAVKMNTVPAMPTLTIRQDSIHFKPVMAEIKPQFRTIHANEISDAEKASVPQPRFKIRFAARNQH